LILQSQLSGDIIVLDTKFTTKSLVENIWGKQLFDSAHLYQMYTYLSTQERQSAQLQKSTGILLYPAVREKLSERIEFEHHYIRIECVDLTASWQNIENQLLEIVAH